MSTSLLRVRARWSASHRDDDLAAGAAVYQVADGGGDLAEGVGPVDCRLYLARLDQLAQGVQVGGVLRCDKSAQFLADEQGQDLRPQLSVGTAEPPAIGLASDDDQLSLGGEGAPEVGQPTV